MCALPARAHDMERQGSQPACCRHTHTHTQTTTPAFYRGHDKSRLVTNTLVGHGHGRLMDVLCALAAACPCP